MWPGAQRKLHMQEIHARARCRLPFKLSVSVMCAVLAASALGIVVRRRREAPRSPVFSLQTLHFRVPAHLLTLIPFLVDVCTRWPGHSASFMLTACSPTSTTWSSWFSSIECLGTPDYSGSVYTGDCSYPYRSRITDFTCYAPGMSATSATLSATSTATATATVSATASATATSSATSTRSVTMSATSSATSSATTLDSSAMMDPLLSPARLFSRTC